MHHFIHGIYLRNALNAAVSRGAVYDSAPSLAAKLAFRAHCQRLLVELGVRYHAWEYDLNRYCDEILEFRSAITRTHGTILAGGKMRIGTAQKMVSLYLKYLWLSGDPSKKPIGAVLDRPILQASGFANPPDWTKLDDISTYRDIQIQIGKKAAAEGFGSPAVWEAEKWGVEEDDAD
jgi:hypothetical protein